ncbi:T9SS type B sorting domain-containing protein [Cellulophaga sp. E16_2]|uniref:T9SS type B sorting domain-containing protein n=1 Tax=Cellulophaga sp. E16_2 TaxID=2789297 RepID=UPI001A921428|nr:T9SS type B sorting domain-containing protein [Cellulophaga sp. E16_2]MBO0590035.1 T9SS type B sorting domain-containing protein [Cellulophaga sp. E16_2]
MKKKYFSFLFFIFTFFTIVAQRETSNWYFGFGAGIHFNDNGSVTPLTNGKLNTLEGCTSISDADGTLLAYTDGITVYNKNHQIVQNGNGLLGDPSSTQSAIIVPKPQDPNIYYIFTVDTSAIEGDPDFGLNYSVLDISQNDGNGAITEKNKKLLTDSSEKIAGVIKDCFDQSIWVITLASESGGVGFFNTYHCYEVSTAGINTNAVKNTFPDLLISDPRGYLKLSSDGTKMVSANAYDGLFVYDFDPKTGILSNQLQLTVPTSNTIPYGVEFSTEGQFLYVNTFNDEEISNASLIQYDLFARNISNSAVVLDERAAYRGALQMAENGKIYRTTPKNYFEGSAYLSVINTPNVKGTAADYVHNAVSLNGKMAMQGLPPFIQSFFNKIDLIKNPDGSTSTSLTICEKETFILEVDEYLGAKYEWEKDGIPLVNPNNHYLEIPSASLADAGKYKLTLTLADPKECPIIGESAIVVNPVPIIENLQIIQCDIDENSTTDGITSLNLEQAYLLKNYPENYKFSFFESTSEITNNQAISNPIGYRNTTPYNQTIYYTATNEYGCSSEGILEISVQATTINMNNESPFYACQSNLDTAEIVGIFDIEQIRQHSYPAINATFYTSLEDASLEQNEISGTYTTPSINLYVRLEKDNECQGVETIALVVNAAPSFTFPEEHYVCTDGEYLDLMAPSGYDSYEWRNTTNNSEVIISTAPTIAISEPGNYRLTLGYDYSTLRETLLCTNSVDFTVYPSNRAQIENIIIKDISDNNTIEVLVTGDGDYEYSLDGIDYQPNPKFLNLAPGFVTVHVQDKKGCGITIEEISIIGYPKFFSPNGDGTNDYWQLIGVDELFQADSEITIFNRYGTLITSITPKSEGWNGNANGKSLPASDYWFKVNLEDGRIFTGHFTLKR